MRKSLLILTAALIVSTIASAQIVMKADSVELGTGYVNEIYYSFKNGVAKTVARDKWDIAFRSKILSSSIIINDGNSVVLYTYPHSDTTGWATVDTAGIASWTPMFNDPDDWENGAFNRNQTGHPDYGWGRYNESTHNLIGDSLYVIQLRNGMFKKLWIQKKLSAADTWQFKYANLDGTDENEVVKDLTSLQGYDFCAYDMEADLWFQAQPLASEWNILFTKYKGINNGQPYTVTGVLSNDSIRVNKFHPVSLDYENWSAAPWDSTRSMIGYDWKVLNNTTFTYDMVDSLVYFIKTPDGAGYKLYFTAFEGSSTGKIRFMTGQIPGLGIGSAAGPAVEMLIYPNPVSDKVNLLFNSRLSQPATVTLSGLTGKTLIHTTIPAGSERFALPVAGYAPGVYLMSVSDANGSTTAKVVIAR